MLVIVILSVTLLALFASAFFSRRRFGILGLGLVAGAVVSPIWGETVGYIISSIGIIPEGPFVSMTALSLLILLPAALFMFHGYTYKNIFGRIIGAFMFTVFAVAFLLGPVGEVLAITGPMAAAYEWLVSNRELIISAGIALSVIDLLVATPSHKGERRRR